jgi:hypothetical protein
MIHPLVTLNKSETFFSPTGQRFIHHAARGSRVLLFVREHRRQGTVTEPLQCLGFVSCESHEGERPMAIRWRLERKIPRCGCRGWRWRFSVLVHAHRTRQAWSAHASRRTAAVSPPAP